MLKKIFYIRMLQKLAFDMLARQNGKLTLEKERVFAYNVGKDISQMFLVY